MDPLQEGEKNQNVNRSLLIAELLEGNYYSFSVALPQVV